MLCVIACFVIVLNFPTLFSTYVFLISLFCVGTLFIWTNKSRIVYHLPVSLRVKKLQKAKSILVFGAICLACISLTRAVIYKIDCPLVANSQEWVVTSRSDKGITIEQSILFGIEKCTVQKFVICQPAKCPHLFTTISIKSSHQEVFQMSDISQILAPNPANFVQWAFWYGYKLKLAFYNKLVAYYGSEVGGLSLSMLLGGDFVSKETKDLMIYWGLSHITAVSGVNITIFLSICAYFMAKLPKRIGLLSEIILICVFLVLTGLSPPTVRAVVQAILDKFTRLLGIRVDSYDLFVATIIICLFLFPWYIFSVSFLLTCAALVGLLYGGKIIDRYVRGGAFHIRILKVFLQSLVIWLCVSVVSFIYFREINIKGLFLGILMGPLVEVGSLFGYIGFGMGTVLSDLGALFVLPLTFLPSILYILPQN